MKALCYQYLPKKVKIRISSVYTMENAPSKFKFLTKQDGPFYSCVLGCQAFEQEWG